MIASAQAGRTKPIDDYENQARNKTKARPFASKRGQSGEIITGQVVHMWEEESVPMVRVASGQLVYNVPARMLVDETKSK